MATCMIPHCRRTTTRFNAAAAWPDDQWICQEHWRLVPAKMKAVKRRVRRALNWHSSPAALTRFGRISSRCTRAALDRAGGI